MTALCPRISARLVLDTKIIEVLAYDEDLAAVVSKTDLSDNNPTA